MTDPVIEPAAAANPAPASKMAPDMALAMLYETGPSDRSEMPPLDREPPKEHADKPRDGGDMSGADDRADDRNDSHADGDGAVAGKGAKEDAPHAENGAERKAGDGAPDEGGEDGEEVAEPTETSEKSEKSEAPEGYFKLLDENSSPEEIAAFREVLGMPETVEGYDENLETAIGDIDGLPAEYEPASWLADLAFSNGLSKDLYQEIVRRDAESVAQAITEMKAETAREKSEAAAAIKTRYGQKSMEKMTLGQRAINHFAKQVDGLDTLIARHGLGQNPKFIEFAIALGEHFGETAFVDGDGGNSRGRDKDTAAILYPNESRKG